MSTEVVTALITGAATVLAGVIAVVFELRKSRLDAYNRYITEERIKWLNIVRSDYSKIMAAYELKTGSNHNSDNLIDRNIYNDRMYEAEMAKYDLLSRLNTSTYEGNEYNLLLKEILEKMHFCVMSPHEIKCESNLTKKEKDLFNEPQKSDIDYFKFYTNKMLEKEWQKSKKETRNEEF